MADEQVIDDVDLEIEIRKEKMKRDAATVAPKGSPTLSDPDARESNAFDLQSRAPVESFPAPAPKRPRDQFMDLLGEVREGLSEAPAYGVPGMVAAPDALRRFVYGDVGRNVDKGVALNALTVGTVPASVAGRLEVFPFLRGAAQGASYGTVDELSGFLNERVKRYTDGIEDEDPSMESALKGSDLGVLWDVLRGQAPDYKRERDDYRRDDALDATESPISFEAGKLAGALFAPGPKGSGTLRSSIGLGALGGGAYSVGESDGLDPGETLLGVAGGALGGAVGHGLGALGSSLMRGAPGRALRSVGITDDAVEGAFKTAQRKEAAPLKQQLEEGLALGGEFFKDGVTTSSTSPAQINIITGRPDLPTGPLADALEPEIAAIRMLEEYPTEEALRSFEKKLAEDMLALKAPVKPPLKAVDGESFYSGFPSERGWQQRANKFVSLTEDKNPTAKLIADLIQSSKASALPPPAPLAQTTLTGLGLSGLQKFIGPAPTRKGLYHAGELAAPALQMGGEVTKASSRYIDPPPVGVDLLNQYLFERPPRRESKEEEAHEAVRGLQNSL